MPQLLNLYQMGARWYAEYRDGAWSQTGPTVFPATMARADVVASIATTTPDVEITDKARNG